MDHRPNIPGSQPHLPPHGQSTQAAGSSTSRRRSHSQPTAPAVLPHPAHPYVGNRPTDHFDFESFLHQVPSGLGLDGYDEDLFAQLSTMSDEQLRQLPTVPSSSPYQPPRAPSHLPTLQEHMQDHGQPQAPNPLLTQTFLAWLQYMHLQNQLSHSNQGGSQQQQHTHPQQTHQPQIPFTFGGLSQQPGYLPTLQLDMSAHQAGPSQPRQRRASSAHQTADSPASEPGEPEMDQAVVTEDKRRRNTAASARFRVKKKQWTLNLERSITDLSGRVEELEREAAELRRENGWLKEIVMLKSKRFGSGSSGQEQLGSSEEPPPPQREDVDKGSDGDNDNNGRDTSAAPDAGKGKGRDVS